MEMLIVVTLTSMLILAATSMLLTTFISSGRTSAVAAVKSNGDFAITQMETMLRNAIEVLPNDSGQTCQTGMTQFRFKSIDESITTLGTESSDGVIKIASNSGVFLTSDQVTVLDGPTFDCRRTDDLAITNIGITFTLRRGNPASNKPTEIQTQEFRTSVTIRTIN